MSSPLQSPRLRRIIAAYTVNRLGTWFGVVALSLAVFDHTHSALAVAALLLAWQALPAFVVPAVIARVEASRRRSELSGLYLFEAAATVSLAVLLWHFSLPAILLLAALDGTAALAAGSLLRSELARAAREEAQAGVERDTYSAEGLEAQAQEAERRANATLNIGFSATFVLGPVLAGVLVAAAGAQAALFADVGSFLLCALALLDLHPHVEEAGEDSVRERLLAAWSHIREAPSLRRLLLADAVALVFFQSAGPIEVSYAKATLHAGDRGYGLLLAMWGVGAVLGSIVFARLIRRALPAMLGAGAFAIGVAYLGFAAAPTLTLACAAALIGGVGNGVELPALISLVQALTPQQLHGRLMGAVESLAALSLALGLSLGGALVALSSPRSAFLVVGLGAMATVLVLLRLSRKATSAPDARVAPTVAPAGPPAARKRSLAGEHAPQEPAPR